MRLLPQYWSDIPIFRTFEEWSDLNGSVIPAKSDGKRKRMGLPSKIRPNDDEVNWTARCFVTDCLLKFTFLYKMVME